MPIISKGGRRSLKVRLIFFAIYAILILGTITMVYPFMLMLSSSVASPFDFDDLRLVPKYLTDDNALIKKFLYAKYGRENLRELSIIYHCDSNWNTWSNIRVENNFINNNYPIAATRYQTNPAVCRQITNDWNQFKKTLHPQDITAFYPDNYDAYRDFLKTKYSNAVTCTSSACANKDNSAALAELNRNWQRAFNNFAEILPLKSFLTQQRWFAPSRPDFKDLLTYYRQLPGEKIKILPTSLLWTLYLEKRFVNTSRFAKTSGVTARQFSDVPIPADKTSKLYHVWQEFLRTKYPLRLLSVRGDYTAQWRKLLQNEFKTVKAFNQQTESRIRNFTDLHFSAIPPTHPILRGYWLNFVLAKIPTDNWSLNRPLDLYHAYLREKYGDVSRINIAYGTDYKTIDKIQLPLKLADYVQFEENKTTIRWHFFADNYLKVMAFLTTKGRALWVTFVLVGLTILGALTVNPLAAYALSRGKQSTSAKILIFFLATMAFPAEVAMIPGFLLLRDLNLLNTFGALVLPGLANGYSIFLLKGFFDSVPRELYEAAEIDGATELTKFWRITFPMSKPILAVIALSAFTMSYGGFMWAFLTCQDPRMWTIMVWLYDFQGRYADQPGMCMAAFTLASLPTLLVFLFCQKIIMRGIVIPTMK